MELTSPDTIRYIKNKYGFNMSKGLGQNFLTDPAVLESICDAAELGDDCGALEIGPGIGVLTAALSKRAKKTVSVEIDERLLPVLSETLEDCDNVSIINADFMKTDLAALINDNFSDCRRVSLCANLPYYITTPIITGVLENKSVRFDNIVVMVQKEVAERLCALPKTKAYGAISLLIRYYCEPEIVTIVPSKSFMPAPKVDSAVVKLKMLSAPSVNPTDEKFFFKTVKSAFLQRRKTLVNALSNAGSASKEDIKNILLSLGISETARGEELSVYDFAKLSDELYKLK